MQTAADVRRDRRRDRRFSSLAIFFCAIVLAIIGGFLIAINADAMFVSTAPDAMKARFWIGVVLVLAGLAGFGVAGSVAKNRGGPRIA